jgi:hypothetical protein
MTKKIMTFEVDQSALFDMIAKMGSNFGPIGERVISAMLTGKTSMTDDIGLGLYGVVFIDARPAGEHVEDEPACEGSKS